MKRRIILLGPPGSGKGTIAARLQEKLGLPHVSSGHWLRSEAKSGSPLGNRAARFLEKGELVPDEIVLELMARWLRDADHGSGFMLDGFPRNLAQAEALDRWTRETGIPLDLALLFDCGLDVVLDRVTGRQSCSACGRVYHARLLPPRVAGRCDDCGAALTVRADDSEAVMRRRFAIYERETGPVVQYYRQQGKLAVVDAAKSPDERLAEALAALT